MTKTLFSALFAATLCLPVCAQPIHAQLDGRTLNFDQPPAMIGGRVMVPLRGIFESLGADVRFDPSSQRITATRGARIVQLSLGSNLATVDGQSVTLDVAANTVGGRTMVPLRFVSEALGAEVRWQESTQTVFLSSGQPTANNLPAPAPVPVPAPPAQQSVRPSLTSVTHNGRGSLRGGDRLQVDADGDFGGRATFDIVGVVNGQAMREFQSGQYRGTFTVPNGLSVSQGALRVHLRKNGQAATMEAPQTVTFDSQARPGRRLPPVARGGNLDLNMTNLAPGATVGAIFNVQGQTDANALVKVSGQSTRALIPGVVALKNATVRGQGQADANGRFNVQVNASSVPANTAILLNVHATDATGRQGASRQLEVTRI